MATIAQIETNLLAATSTGNATLLTQTLNSITTTQISQISSSAIRDSLYNLATPNMNFSTSASMTRSFMAKLGSKVDASIFMNVAENFASSKNFAGLDALTDNMTTANLKYTNGNGLALGGADMVVREISYADNRSGTSDDTTIANAMRDFMTKLGTYVSNTAYIAAVELFAASKNFVALDAMLDTLSANNLKYANGNNFAIGGADRVLRDIAYNDNSAVTSDDQAIATVVRDFMAKLGAYVSNAAYIEALELFAATRNFAALDSMLDTLSANNLKYTNGNSFALGGADHTLREIAYNDNRAVTTDDQAIATVVRDFMAKLGTYVSATAYMEVVELFSASKNWAALDAVLDTITANNKRYANGYNLALGEVDDALRNIVYNDNTATTSDNAVITNVVRGFMSKLGGLVSAQMIIDSATMFAESKNFAALDAVTDNLNSANKTYANGSSMAIGSVDNIVRAIVHGDNRTTTSDDSAISDVLRDFMGKLGNYASSAVLSETARILADSKNINGLDALLSELDSATLNTLSTAAVNAIKAAGVTYLANGNDTHSGNASANTIFGAAGNDTIYGNDGNDALYGDAGNDWLEGGNGNDILSGGAGKDVLIGGAGNDVLRGGTGQNDLTGGLGADRFVFDATDLGRSTNRIADFNRTQGDKIDISDVLEIADPTTATLSQFVKLTAGADGVHTLSVDVNGTEGGTNFVALATIVGVANGTTAEQLLTAGNLVV